MDRATAAVRLLSGEKEPVRFKTTGNHPLAGLAAVNTDGVTPLAGDRALVDEQDDATQNGIYTTSGGTWYRAPDSASSRSMIKGMKVHVQEGDTFGGDIWQLDTNKPDIGDDEIEFSLFLSSGMAEQIAAAQVALEAASEAIIALGLSAGKATQAEAVAGTSNVPWMTPLRTRQAIAVGATGVAAWDNSVPGDGSDQTVALQALIDATPSSACNIYLRGDVTSSLLDLHGRNHINFLSASGSGGINYRATLNMSTGAGVAGAPAIDCRGTNDVGFRGVNIIATNATFNGKLLHYGDALAEYSAAMVITDCYISTLNATSATGLWLAASLGGRFDQINFQGKGRCVNLDTAVGGFSNDHTFLTCTFAPGANVYSIVGSGCEANFVGCIFQQCPDGVGRGYRSQDTKQFLGLNFIGCNFTDNSVVGDNWIYATWGNGFNLTGCTMSGGGGSPVGLGGAGTADPQDSGVRGVSIQGNYFGGVSSAIFLNGTIAAKTNVRGAVIGGNTVTNGVLLSSTAQTEQLVLLPNSIYGAPLGFGAHMTFIGLPSYASDAAAVSAGLQVGQMYRVGNELRVV